MSQPPEKHAADRVPAEVDRIFRKAVACRDCFTKSNLAPALIDIAQPRWIGENYWDSDLRTVIVLINPAAGKRIHDRANEEFRRRIRSYGTGQGEIEAVFDHQESEIPRWGNGKFAELYLDRFGLRLTNIRRVRRSSRSWTITASCWLRFPWRR